MKPLEIPAARAPLARLAVFLAGYVVLFVLIYLFTVHTVTGRELAEASLRGAIAAQPLLSGTVNRILDVVSVASLLGAVAVVSFIALVRLLRLEGMAAIGILVASNASTWLLKNVILPRPDLGLSEVAPSTLNSLPSGHATAVFSAVAALVFVTPRQWRAPTATVGAGFAALTGLATMLAGWHRASDCVAAFLLVGAWTCVATAVVVVLAPPAANDSDAAAHLPVRWLAPIAIGTLVLGTVLAVGFIAASLSPGNALGSLVAFVAGAMYVIGAAAAATIGVLATIDTMEAAS